MSDHGDDVSRLAPAVRPRNPYRGRPENQRDPRADNVWKGPPRAPREPQPPKLTPHNAPRALPKPTQLHDTSHVKLTEVSPADGSVFSTGMSVREVAPRQTFSPSAPALIDISRQCYSELITDDPNLTKTILPEYFDYYSAALLWMRLVTLKQKKFTVTHSRGERSPNVSSEHSVCGSRTNSTATTPTGKCCFNNKTTFISPVPTAPNRSNSRTRRLLRFPSPTRRRC